MTLEQYIAKDMIHPLVLIHQGPHPQGCHRPESLLYTDDLGPRTCTYSHPQSCLLYIYAFPLTPTGGSSGVFSSTLLMFRGGHHIIFVLILMMMCPTLFGISLTQQIALTSDNHLEFFSLTSWRRPYTFLAFVSGWNHEPFIRGFLSGL